MKKSLTRLQLWTDFSLILIFKSISSREAFAGEKCFQRFIVIYSPLCIYTTLQYPIDGYILVWGLALRIKIRFIQWFLFHWLLGCHVLNEWQRKKFLKINFVFKFTKQTKNKNKMLEKSLDPFPLSINDSLIKSLLFYNIIDWFVFSLVLTQNIRFKSYIKYWKFKIKTRKS